MEDALVTDNCPKLSWPIKRGKSKKAQCRNLFTIKKIEVKQIYKKNQFNDCLFVSEDEFAVPRIKDDAGIFIDLS